MSEAGCLQAAQRPPNGRCQHCDLKLPGSTRETCPRWVRPAGESVAAAALTVRVPRGQGCSREEGRLIHGACPRSPRGGQWQ